MAKKRETLKGYVYKRGKKDPEFKKAHAAKAKPTGIGKLSGPDLKAVRDTADVIDDLGVVAMYQQDINRITALRWARQLLDLAIILAGKAVKS